MRSLTGRTPPVGVLAALGAAVLFGAGTPVSKTLLGATSPWMLAGVLYTASGVALWAYRRGRRAPAVRLPRTDRAALAGAVISGGMIGPVLLMSGLARMPASGASLLLNAEGVLTALIAWVLFRESTDRRIVTGFALIAAGAVVLSRPGQATFAGALPVLAVLGACLAWGMDNNLTGRLSLTDATWLAMIKGLVAGPVNLALAVMLGARWPGAGVLAAGAAVGVLAYGVSLALFIVGMRHLGTARAGAYFAVAPFFGAVLAVATGEPVTPPLLIAGVLMAAGVWLHVTERHDHEHTHTPITHTHAHRHDDLHHDHVHLDDARLGHGHREHGHPDQGDPERTRDGRTRVSQTRDGRARDATTASGRSDDDSRGQGGIDVRGGIHGHGRADGHDGPPRHDHVAPVMCPDVTHVHEHTHDARTHRHRHYPDAHHRHPH